MNILGRRIREMRERYGLSQSQVADYAGIGQSTISEIENGKIMPKTVSAVAALAPYFDTTADYLVGLTDDPSPAPRRELPEHSVEVLEIMRELSPARTEELVKIARVLLEGYKRRQRLEWLTSSLESAGDTMLRNLAMSVGDPQLIVAALEAALRVAASRRNIGTDTGCGGGTENEDQPDSE